MILIALRPVLRVGISIFERTNLKYCLSVLVELHITLWKTASTDHRYFLLLRSTTYTLPRTSIHEKVAQNMCQQVLYP